MEADGEVFASQVDGPVDLIGELGLHASDGV